MARSWIRGHLAEWDGEAWRYADTGEVADHDRPCVRCGKLPTPEGHDACLGYVPGVMDACCGHGVHEPWIRRKERDGEKDQETGETLPDGD